MGASRTRQTRAAVSYKLDSSSDDSDVDASFKVPRTARNDSSRGNDGEVEPGNGKGRRTLALKKNRSQDRGESRDEERAHGVYLDQNTVRQHVDVSAPSVGLQETGTSAFQHLLDVAFDATDAKKLQHCKEDGDEAVEDGRQTRYAAAGAEDCAHQAPHLEESKSSPGEGQALKLCAQSMIINGEEGSCDRETSATNPIRQRPKALSKNHPPGSDDDDWLKDDVVDGDVADSGSDFSSEGASDSDIDLDRPARKRQSTKPVVKKSQQSASRISVTKGPRTKSSAADRKVSSNGGQKVDEKKTPAKSVGRRRKIVSPSATSVTRSAEGTGGIPCIARLQPVKLRMKMANKEGNSDGSPNGSAGGVPAQLISPNNVPHRRVLGLSRRCRPPPLHPYLGGT